MPASVVLVSVVPICALFCRSELCHAILCRAVPQVLDAVKQLAACSHRVKNLKLEAQGIRGADLEGLGDKLVTLPCVTWLTLNLQYTAPRQHAARCPHRQQQQQGTQDGGTQTGPAAAGGAASSTATAGAAPGQGSGAGGQQGLAAAAGAEAAIQQAGGPSAAAAAGAAAAGSSSAAATDAPAREPGSSRYSEPAAKLSNKLLQHLPGTVLELRVRPYMMF